MDSYPSIKTNLTGPFIGDMDATGRDVLSSPLSESSMENSASLTVDDFQARLHRLQSENEFLQECLKKSREDYISVKAELIETKRIEIEQEVLIGELDPILVFA